MDRRAYRQDAVDLRATRTRGRSALALLVTIALGWPSTACPDSSRHGATDMLEPFTAGLLVDYYESFLHDQDFNAFRRSVRARYTEGTLARLAQNGNAPARRAAILALGLTGGMSCNGVVAGALKDPDPSVRGLAHSALWAIWFRAGQPEDNATLEEVHELISRGRYEEAQQVATRLIDRAPSFAEAHNQRAIAEYFQGHLDASAADCLRTLELNPYHIGALSGLGQCYIRMGDRTRALEIYRRALELQPYSETLRELIVHIEQRD
jgi:tetratricopeptide (TPR) repeat protein